MAKTRQGFIIADPNVMMGKPVVAGTRITVEPILEELDACPRLIKEGVRAALACAAEVLHADVVYPVR